ncbi:MAG TPA: hypothetical protein VFW39_11650 [Sphingomicrobium sp.]|nr:hypothetical protein [Sphingomicrobium sp.]
MTKLLLILFLGGALLNFLAPSKPQLLIEKSPAPYHSPTLDAPN